MIEKEIAKDLSEVVKRAKIMGCKEVKAFTHIPLNNVEAVIKALDKQIPNSYRCVTDDDCITCGNCRSNIDRFIDDDYEYCPYCGQKL